MTFSGCRILKFPASVTCLMFPDKLQNILYGSALSGGHSQSHTPPSHYPHLYFCEIKGYFQIFQVIYFHYEYWKKILPYLPQEQKIIQCQEKSALMSSECFKKFKCVFMSRRLKKRPFFQYDFVNILLFVAVAIVFLLGSQSSICQSWGYFKFLAILSE